MSTIPGPIITFRWDTGDLSAQVQRAFKGVERDVKQFGAQFKAALDPSQAIAAATRLRTAIAQGIVPSQQIAAEQRKIVGLLNQEINVIKAKESLTTKELGRMKALTLELERQKNALERGSSIGITRGTEEAMRRATQSAQVFLNLTGVQMPRAIQNLIVQSNALGAAFGAAFKVGVIALVAREAFNLLDRLTGISEQYRKIEAANQATVASVASMNRVLLGPQTFEQLNLRFVETQKRITALNQALGLTGDVLGDSIRRGLTRFSPAQRLLVEELEKSQKLTEELAADMARLAEERRREPLEILKIEGQARLAGLDGFRRVEQEKIEALRQVNEQEKLNLITAKLAAAERTKIVAESNAKVRELARQHAEQNIKLAEQVAGIGASRLSAIGLSAEADIGVARRERDRGALSAEAFAEREAAIRTRAARETIELQRRAAVEGQAAILRAEAAGTQGRERINRDFLATLQDITQREIDLGIELSRQRVAAEIEKNEKIKALALQHSEELRRLEQAAAIAALPAIQRANARIIAEAEERARKVNEQLERGEFGPFGSDEANQAAAARVAAIWKKAAADMRDDMASELEGFFDDLASGSIGQRIQKNIRKFMIEQLAGAIINARAGTGPIGGALGQTISVVLGLPSVAGAVPTAGATLGGGLPGTGPGGTPGTFPGPIGLPRAGVTTPTGSVSVTAPRIDAKGISQATLSAQLVQAQDMRIQAVNVTLAGPVSVGGTAGGGANLLGVGTTLLGLGGVIGGGGGSAPAISSAVGGGTAGGPPAISLPGGIPTSATGQVGRGQKIASVALGLGGTAVTGFSLGQSLGPVGGGILGAGLGAATGAAVGSTLGTALGLGAVAGPIGLAIGAVVGGIAGIFGGGAKKRRRREEEAQRRILEEQQRIQKLIADQEARIKEAIEKQTVKGLEPGVFKFAAGPTLAETFRTTFTELPSSVGLPATFFPTPIVPSPTDRPAFTSPIRVTSPLQRPTVTARGARQSPQIESLQASIRAANRQLRAAEDEGDERDIARIEAQLEDLDRRLEEARGNITINNVTVNALDGASVQRVLARNTVA